MSEWINSTVGQVTIHQRAGGTPTASVDEYYGGDIPFVAIEDITKSSRFLDKTEKQLSAKGLENSAAWLIKEPHILYSMYATVGKPIINRIQCATNQAIIALKESSVIDQTYLYYQLLFIRPQVYKFTSQTTQSNLNASTVKKLPIAYPNDLGQQQRIAAILTSIDEAIEKTESLIAKYQQIKAGLMHDLFTRGVTADGKLRPPREQAPELYRETPIGWIPKEWDISCLKEKALPGVPHLRTGPFGSALKGEHWVEVGHPVITIGALGEGEFIEPELLYIGDIDANRLRDFQLKESDVVFSRVADVGRSVVVREQQSGWIMSSNLMRISLDRKQAMPDLLQLQLSFDNRVKLQIKAKVNSGGRDVANSQILNQLLFVWPPFDEQELIVERSAAIDLNLRFEKSKKDKLEKQKLGLMHDLLTGQVRVNAKLSTLEDFA